MSRALSALAASMAAALGAPPLAAPARRRWLAAALSEFDARLLWPVAMLAATGLVMVASASMSYAAEHHGDPFHFVRRHAVHLALAAAGGVVAFALPLSFWRRFGVALLAASMLALALALMPGIGLESGGSRRWLGIGPLTVQPSELLKLGMLAYFAGYLERRRDALRRRWAGLLAPLLPLSAALALLLLEPDFGAAAILFVSMLGMLFLGGVRFSQFAAVTAAGAAAMALSAFGSAYRYQRLVAYLDPWQDPYHSGYQLSMSLIAFGRGEWFGVGLGNGLMKEFYLPKAHNDFIFSALAEEWGLLGCLALIALFAWLVAAMLRVGWRSLARRRPFAAHLCYGAALLLAVQAFVNMAVATGLLPTTGLPLPLVSHGGNSLLLNAALVGIVLRAQFDLSLERARWSSRGWRPAALAWPAPRR